MKKGKKLLLVFSVGFLLAGCSCSNGEIIAPPTNNIEKVEGEFNLQKMYEETKSTTVAVYAYNSDESQSLGTGIVYKEEGKQAYILTNAHVLYVKESSNPNYNKQIDILFSNGKKVKGTFVALDRNEDVGVIKIPQSDDYSVAKIVNTDLDTKIGETVYAIGHPNGDLFSVSNGVIIQNRKKTNLGHISSDTVSTYVFNSSATINPGNSGGALFNKNGEVVSINTMYPVKQGVVDNFRNYNYSLPINHCIDVANAIVPDIGGTNKFVRSKLDVIAKGVNEYEIGKRPGGLTAETGVYVESTGHAELEHKVITKVGNYPVQTALDLEFAIFTKYGASETVILTVTNASGAMSNEISVKIRN